MYCARLIVGVSLRGHPKSCGDDRISMEVSGGKRRAATECRPYKVLSFLAGLKFSLRVLVLEEFPGSAGRL